MFSYSKVERREAAIRSNLLEQLKECVHSLIQGPDDYGIPRLSASIPKGPVIGHTDNTNSLCCVFEAIFIHGLKDTLGEKISMFLGDVDRMPIPNFWPVVMVISHRDLLEQVSSLMFITSEVGKGRAWIRLALNQGQLLSYFSVLASDKDTLKDYYKSLAFLRDIESCDIMLRVLQPLTGITFKLATNAAVLNTWTQTPLMLSGTWILSNYEQGIVPVVAATDVVSTFLDDSCQESGTFIPHTPISDKMFELIIGGTPETKFIDDNYSEWMTSVASSCLREKKMGDQSFPEEIGSVKETCQLGQSSSSFKDNRASEIPSGSDTAVDLMENSSLVDIGSDLTSNENNDVPLIFERTLSMDEESTLDRSVVSSAPDSEDYKTLFCGIEALENAEYLPPFLRNLPLNYAVDQTDTEEQRPCLSPDCESKDFEMVSSGSPTEEELRIYSPLLGVLQNESGLDKQNYQCYGKNCSVPIGMLYGKPRLCHYDGKYYCYDCHDGEVALIPARILHCWDFKEYPVAKCNKKWLDSIFMRPLIDLRLLSPKLYKFFDNLAELQSLRIQLHFIQAYLFTCPSLVIGQELRKMLWPREYLYEHVHLYSVCDLRQVSNGKLLTLLREAVKIGKNHITTCRTCFPRGFICEICKMDQIIYPFQLDDTHTCNTCSGVFHRHCADAQPQCPKCLRIQIRRMKLSEEEPS